MEWMFRLGLPVAAVLWLPMLARQSQRNAAKETPTATCQANLKQVALGMLQYVNDWDELYPPVAMPYTRGRGTTYGWANSIDPYVRTMAVYQCPAEKRAQPKDPRKPGYTDFWYNRNVAGKPVAEVETPALTLILGDGDGGSRDATARYNLNQLPRA